VLEVALRKDQYQNSLDECFHIVQPMMPMVDILLSLPQIEKERFQAETCEIELREFISDCWRAFVSLSKDGRFQLTLSAPVVVKA
jgi:hypothetical protein